MICPPRGDEALEPYPELPAPLHITDAVDIRSFPLFKEYHLSSGAEPPG